LWKVPQGHRNQVLVEQAGHQTPENVLAEFREAHTRFLRVIERLSEEDVLLQIVALVRSLRLEDDDPNEYRKTVRWFTTSAVVLLIGLLIATVVFAGTPEPK
jgi:hypothetical protein